MNRDLEDSIQEDDSMQVTWSIRKLSFKQSKVINKYVYLLNANILRENT